MKRTVYLVGLSSFVCLFLAIGLMFAEKRTLEEGEVFPGEGDPSNLVDPIEASLAVVPLDQL